MPLCTRTRTSRSVAAELPLCALRAIEDQLVLGAVVDPIGAPTSVIGVQQRQPAFLAPDHLEFIDDPPKFI
jgi:hypothetical protein